MTTQLALVVCLIGAFIAILALSEYLTRTKCPHQPGSETYECRNCHKIVWSDR